MQDGRIVISYSREDALFVRKLRKKLEALEFSIWQDLEDLRPGKNGKTASIGLFGARRFSS